MTWFSAAQMKFIWAIRPRIRLMASIARRHNFAALSFPRPIFYPNGITVSGDGNLLYVADLLGVVCVDLRNNSAHEVEPGKGSTLAGIDGLYWHEGSLVGVQYGTGSFRVMRWGL